MRYRQLGRSGLMVSVLSLGTMTFGGRGAFEKTGSTDVAGARRLIDRCRDAGVNLIDTANVYSRGLSEEILGEALAGGAGDMLIATKVRFPMGDGPNDRGLSRHHIIAECEASLRRLRVGHVDLYQLHQWDGLTPLEETLEALDRLQEAGKVRYVGASNYSGWHLMKALAVQDRDRRVRLVSQQIHYTLEAREAEYELVPISVDQGLGILVWSPLAGACSPASTAEVRTDRRAPGTSTSGTSRRSATRSACGTSSRRWWRWPTAAASSRLRQHWPGCSAARRSRRSWWVRGPSGSWRATSPRPTSC